MRLMETNGMYLTPEELAARIRVAPSTLAKWRMEGDGPAFYKFGKRVLYRLDIVEEWERGNLRLNTAQE